MEAPGGHGDPCSEFAEQETLYCLIAFGVAIRSCFLLHGESSSFKKSCPQGLPSNFWGKQKIFLGMLGFSVKKNQQNSVFHFFTSPFFPFCSWKDKDASMKKKPQSWWKTDSIWTMPTRVAKLAKVTKKKSNPFFSELQPHSQLNLNYHIYLRVFVQRIIFRFFWWCCKAGSPGADGAACLPSSSTGMHALPLPAPLG